MIQYIALGLEREVAAWRREQGLSPREVIQVSPSWYTGALRGYTLDCEVVTFPSWRQASPDLMAAVEMDIRICRAKAPARGEGAAR